MNTAVNQTNLSFFSQFPRKRYSDNQIILRAGDEPAGIYFIKEGLVRVYALSKEGDEVCINFFKPGAFFQLSWSLNRTPNRYYYQAVKQTTVYIAPLKEVEKYLKREPEVLMDLNQRLLSGLDGITRHMEQLLQGTAEAKVVHSLLLLCYRLGETSGQGVVIKYPFTHQELAAMAGTSRETVSRIMSALQKNKMIVKQGRSYVVPDVAMLESLL